MRPDSIIRSLIPPGEIGNAGATEMKAAMANNTVHGVDSLTHLRSIGSVQEVCTMVLWDVLQCPFQAH
jgi:hypothetical protein